MGVSEGVVDVLEPVEIHDENGPRLGGPLGRGQCLEHELAEQRAIRQAGQPVVQRLVLKRVGVGPVLGDVAHRGEGEAPFAVGQVAVLDLHRERRAVATTPERLRPSARRARRGRPLAARPRGEQVVTRAGGEHEGQRLPDQLVLAIAEQRLGRPVQGLDHASSPATMIPSATLSSTACTLASLSARAALRPVIDSIESRSF